MINKPQPHMMAKLKSGPQTRRKRSQKIRLRVFYEAANEKQRATAIMLLASMYREVAVNQQLKDLKKESRGQLDAQVVAFESRSAT